MADITDDIKARLNIVDIVGAYVQLKKAGVNYKGVCPFHSEKTPSFIVSPEKQIFHCFGCNKGGDIFTFIEEAEGVQFPEALQFLADKAGIKVDNLSKFWKKEKKSEKDIFFKAHELAAEFFEKQLNKTNDGKKVLEYLKKRGINDDTIKEFRIGFAPDSYSELNEYLLKKGIPKDILLKSGLVSAKNIASENIYDKYRARLIFPIFDYMGRICGFGGRALKKDQMPKYLNSPENIIYNKSKILYGLSHAKRDIKEKDKIILVEGYFDVILPYQEGVKNICATSGTALTEAQVRLINRLTNNMVCSFDSDEAGQEAAYRAYTLARDFSMNVQTMGVSSEKDPADFVLKKGAEEFIKKVDNAQDFLVFYVESLTKEFNPGDASGRRKILDRILPFYKKLPPASKDFYIKELSKKMNIPERFLYDEIENFKLPPKHPARTDEVSINPLQRHKFDCSEILISIVLEYPKMLENLKDLAVENHFDNEMKSIYKILFDQYNQSRNGVVEWDLKSRFSSDLSQKLDILKLYAEDRYTQFSDESITQEIKKLVDKIKETRKNSRLKELQIKICEAEEKDDKESLLALLKEQQEVFKEEL